MNNLLISSKALAFEEYCDKYVFVCFGKDNTILKNKVTNNIYELEENIIRANVNKGSIRNKYQKEILVNLMLLDLYIKKCFDKKIFKKKRFNSVLGYIGEIRKMLYGWMSEKEK